MTSFFQIAVRMKESNVESGKEIAKLDFTYGRFEPLS